MTFEALIALALLVSAGVRGEVVQGGVRSPDPVLPAQSGDIQSIRSPDPVLPAPAGDISAIATPGAVAPVEAYDLYGKGRDLEKEERDARSRRKPR